MKKLINRLTFLDAILWGQMLAVVFAGAMLGACHKEARDYPVMINRGNRPAQIVVSDEYLAIGTPVEFEGAIYLVVENDLSAANVQLMADEEKEFNETYPKN